MKDRNKINQIKLLIEQYNAIVIIITETWLDPSVLDSEIQIPGFSIFRSDRCNRTRGGVCIYTRCDLPVTKLHSYSNSVVETVTVKISNLDMIINGIYRPPNTKNDEFKDALDKIENIIDDHNGNSMNIVIAGDFNMKDVNWNNLNCGLINGLNGYQVNSLMKFMNHFF